jgi:hypothetical protein
VTAAQTHTFLKAVHCHAGKGSDQIRIIANLLLRDALAILTAISENYLDCNRKMIDGSLFI